ncbi:MAG TPA: hypothetical protein VLA22_10170, partial [Gaiellaceae bacterium]|nr:hypothetical protein [Gaiellaceae bacterium]
LLRHREQVERESLRGPRADTGKAGELRDAGFVLEDLIEVRPPKGAKARFEFASADWARRWPSEEIWVARKSS